MKYGARNKIMASVKSVKKGDIMSLVKYDVILPAEMVPLLVCKTRGMAERKAIVGSIPTVSLQEMRRRENIVHDAGSM